MLLSIIISTKNKQPEILEKTLHSIVHVSQENTEVIIIDQNSDQRMRSLVEAYAKENKRISFAYIPSSDTGLSKGRNIGLSHAIGEWLLFFDDDAIMKDSPAFFLLTYSTNQVLYGKILTLEDKKPYLRRAIQTEKLSILNFDSVCSIGLLIPMKIMKKIGLFDERFGVGTQFGAGEESDIVLRIMLAGITIRYTDSFVVFHPRSLPDLNKAKQYGLGIGALYRKHIFDTIFFFICLSVRMIIEFTIRLFLILYFYLKQKREQRVFHIVYLKNFLHGFTAYSRLK